MTSTARPRFLVTLLLALVSLCARAELADREKPVNVEADRLSVDDKKKESLFEGNVTMTQGTMVLKADRVFVRQDADGNNFAVAYGRPAYFKQKREGFDEYVEGWSERMEYDGKQDKVQLFINGRVTKGTDEVRGDYISYDAVTEFYQVIGGGKAAASPTNPNGRVRAVIQPKRKDQPAGTASSSTPTPATPLKPAPGIPGDR